jgi:hypothetical protein
LFYVTALSFLHVSLFSFHLSDYLLQFHHQWTTILTPPTLAPLLAILAMAEEGHLIQEMIEKEQEGVVVVVVVVVVGRVARERIKLILLVGS